MADEDGNSEGGYTRRDPDQNAGYTRRDPNAHAGYTRRDSGGEYVGRHRADNASASGGLYRPSGENVYDDQGGGGDGYTRRLGPNHDGYTRRDSRSKRDLKNAEEGATGGSRAKALAANGLSGLLNSEKQGAGSADSPFNYKPTGAKFGNARGFLKKHRKKVVAGSLAGIGFLPLLALLVFLIGALKIPHFVENVAAWRFAKITRQYRLSMNNVMGEKNAIDTLEDGDAVKAKAKYGKYAIFDKVNRLRPNRVIQSLQTNDRIQYNYKETLFGRQKLVSITLAPGENLGNKMTVKVPSGKFGLDRIIHPIRTLDQYKTISEALDAAMKAHDPKIPLVTRTLATRLVLQEAGASLKGMAASKYLGSNNQTAELNKIYSDLTANATKYNALVQQYTELASKYNDIYKQHADVYNEWQPLYKEYQAAQAQWTSVYGQLQSISGSPSEDLLREVADAAEKLDVVSNDFQAKSAVLKDFLGQLKGIRDQMSGIKAELHALYSERVTLTEKYSANGGTLSDTDAKVAIEQETYEKAHRAGGVGGLSQENSRKIAQDAADAEDAAVKDKAQMTDLVNKGLDVPDSVNNVIEKGLNAGTLSKLADTVVGAINPVYDIALPVCMAYDGSKITKDGVDAQHDSKVSEAAYVLSTGDQQKNGNDFTTVMAGAMNWKLGNIQESNAIRRVSGKPVDTLAGTGGQRTTLGTYGEYTIFDVFHLSSLNGVADSLCPTLTNFWVGLGIGVGNLVITGVLSFFTGGGAAAGEVTATQAAEKAAEEGLTQAAKRLITTATKKTLKSFGAGGRFAKQFIKDGVKYGSAAAAATIIASMIVNHAAGLDSSGLEKDVAFTDNVDDGAEQLSGDMGRANFYARPLNNAEVAQSHVADQAELAYNLQHESSFERYLALENPNSLVSRMAITTGSLLDRSMFASLLNSLASLFNPVGLSSKLFAGLNSTTTLAAANEDTQDYGNVVWGYSAAEQQLMQQDSYASPSENSYVLDQSGKESEIESKYSKCYSDSIGTLLSNGDIQRSDSQGGNVKDTGDCSPQNLGPNNPTYGDLVFRWRLKHNYENTTDTLLGVQDPGSSSATAATSGNIPSGTAQELATKIINSNTITFQTPAEKTAMQHIADTGRANDCGAPSVSPILLGVILAISDKYKIVVGVLDDGHSCDGGFHPKGMAADINGINPLAGGSGGTGNFITQADYNSNTLLKQAYGDIGDLLAEAGGGGMGQIGCFSSNNIPTKNAKVTYFDDTCNHLHVDVGHR